MRICLTYDLHESTKIIYKSNRTTSLLQPTLNCNKMIGFLFSIFISLFSQVVSCIRYLYVPRPFVFECLLRVNTKKIPLRKIPDDIDCTYISTSDTIHMDRIALCSTIAISAGEMIGRMQNSPLAYLRMRANSTQLKIAPPGSYTRNSSTSSERYEHRAHNREQTLQNIAMLFNAEMSL